AGRRRTPGPRPGGTMVKPQTIGELRQSEYEVVSVKQEMRRNLARKIRAGEELFPGIVGYEESVIPQLEHAIMSGQDAILLGERGTATARLHRPRVNLRAEEPPVSAGCEISDDPYLPICHPCRDKVAEHGDAVEIHWLARDLRYGEKLATPDITIADLIG